MPQTYCSLHKWLIASLTGHCQPQGHGHLQACLQCDRKLSCELSGWNNKLPFLHIQKTWDIHAHVDAVKIK